MKFKHLRSELAHNDAIIANQRGFHRLGRDEKRPNQKGLDDKRNHQSGQKNHYRIPQETQNDAQGGPPVPSHHEGMGS
jgi:hypothetical protein